MRKLLSATVSAVLAASLLQSGPAPAAAGLPSKPHEDRVVPVTPVPVLPLSQSESARYESARYESIRSAQGDTVATAVAPLKTAAITVDGTPARVDKLDRPETGGLAFRLSRADGLAAAGTTIVTVDYGQSRQLHGADWAHRLRLVRLSDGSPVETRNEAGKLTAVVDVEKAGTDFAVTAGPSGNVGAYTATPLALSSSWEVSGQTGEFTWNYPLRMPETPGNLAPQLALSYSSGSIDGRTASTNNQPSWAGEGFDLWSGYIERSYKSCADDLAAGQPKTGDLCWSGENATMALGGHSGPLVRDSATGTWRLRKDDGTRIEKLTGADNGDRFGDHWKVTTQDGVQYFFGSRPASQSTWTVPVFGNQDGEPCHAATFATSWCARAYKWNLDLVVDPRDNTITYTYAKETNSYGLNMGARTEQYDRGGVLTRADYGTRRGDTGTGPASVVFATANRCVATDCAPHTATAWPDVPWDQQCSANCKVLVSPTFWSTKRLTGITTYVGATAVERWSLEHSFPGTGDTTSASLWLAKLTHTGLVGGTATMPAITFGGETRPNRLNTSGDGLPPMNKYRIIAVNNEFGGSIGVNYSQPECVAGALPAPDSNTKRCFPQYWQPEGGQPLTDWMHKYVVESITEVDRVGASPTQITSYEYLGGAAWHYSENELAVPARRTWSDWRGYQRVIVRNGHPTSLRSQVEYRYFRGMNGDRTSGGGIRSVSISDSQGGSVPDDNQFHGQTRETITYNGSGGPVLGSTVNDLWQRGPTATQGPLKAYMVDIASVRERTALSGGGWRRTQINRAYNSDGQVIRIDDLGDPAVAGDEECTRTTYRRDEQSWLVSLPSRVETVAVACGVTPSYPRDAVSDMLTDYDTAGNPVRVRQALSYTGGQPVYTVVNRSTFDSYGRPEDTYDALDRKTMTRYTETAGLTTKMTVTNALGHVTTTDLIPAWGEPLTSTDANGRRTDVRYDPLGRVTGVWLPGRSVTAGEGPHLRYRYLIRTSGASAVTTETLRANGNYVVSHALYDGFLRARQTQTPASGGGRVITDTIYDDQGRVVKANGNYYAEGAPGTTLVAAGDNNIPNQTVNVYDGAGRVVIEKFMSLDVEQWRTTTAYGGDRIQTTPPAGATATTAVLDAKGRTVELHQQGAVTRYTYANNDQLATITDAAGNQWRYTYDLGGRRIAVHDPDKGDSTATFDAAGQALTTTDARGQTLAYTYDALGRKTSEREGSATGPVRATWTYDTLLKGLPVASTRDSVTTQVLGYDAANRPTGTKVTVPTSEGPLAGVYQSNITYRADGSPASVSLPRAGDLAAETLTYTYDDLGFPKTASGASTYAADTLYTRFGELSQLALGAAGKRVWTSLYYDEPTRRLRRTLVEREAASGVTVNDFRYRHDPAGNVTSIADVPAGGPSDIQCLTYDHLRRMTSAWTASSETCGPATSGYRTTYSYDVTGNRTGEVQHGLGGAGDTTRTYRYTGHRLDSVTTSSPTGSIVDTYRYDATGNTTSRTLAGDTQTLAWDRSGRLTSAQAPDGKVTSLGYDADGNRVLRRDPATTTLYLGAQEIRLDRSSGVLTGTRYYTHSGMLVAVRTAAGLHWQAADHHGTATTMVEAATLAVSRRQFTPFGGHRGAAPASWPGEKGFVGGTEDASLGLVQLGAREYDPALGRFLSVDPIIDADDPQQLNGYAYANNNPATMSDPDGLFYFVDVEGRVTIPSKKYATPRQIKAATYKAKQITQRNVAYKKWYDNAVKASGHSRKEYREAQKIKQKSVLDVAIEAGGEILMEFLGINDIKGCFNDGDIGSCISMVVNVIPWSKLFRLGELIGAVKRAWKAVSSFAAKQKWADDVIKSVDESVAACAAHSFRPDTRVRMADGGSKPIGQVKLGDKVLATDPRTGATGPREVVALHINTDRDLVDVSVRRPDGSAGTVHTTEHHPFWSETDKAWVDAGALEPGDRLSNGVMVVEVTRVAGAQVMRDLTVDGVHTYHVETGAVPILVHNNDVCRGNPFPEFDPKKKPDAPEGKGNTGQDDDIDFDSGERARTEGENRDKIVHASVKPFKDTAGNLEGQFSGVHGMVGPEQTVVIVTGAVLAGGKAAYQRVRKWFRK